MRAAGLALAGLALLGCGGPEERTGDIAVTLRWLGPETPGTRGVLSGVVDDVRLQARRSGRVEAEATCAYEDYACDLLEVAAGSGYSVLAEGLDGELVAFRGESASLTVADGQVTEAVVSLAPAYSVDIYAPAAVDDLAGVWTATPISGLELTWHATGNDAWLGRASTYDVRWSFSAMDEVGFEGANVVDGPTPSGSGAAERFLLRGLPSGDVYVRLRVLDNATPTPNKSGLSNEVMVTVP
ncbi:MAG TPA: hypothetical protein PK668_01785 [Myxococcota bacterium]|nr:hypothetical protein [Myxococcota bacterium]HRY94702.1 hypothetical protein [Myxococcota bacterium]HSA23638.1 hypothetical protein [Myxococcota bacterium]